MMTVFFPNTHTDALSIPRSSLEYSTLDHEDRGIHKQDHFPTQISWAYYPMFWDLDLCFRDFYILILVSLISSHILSHVLPVVRSRCDFLSGCPDPYSCLDFSFVTQVYMSTHVTCDTCAQSLAYSFTVTHLLRNFLSIFASTPPLLVSIPYPVRSRAQSWSASYYYTWYNVLTHNHRTLCDTVHMFLSHNHHTSHRSWVKGCDGRSDGFFQAWDW